MIYHVVVKHIDTNYNFLNLIENGVKWPKKTEVTTRWKQTWLLSAKQLKIHKQEENGGNENHAEEYDPALLF